MATKNQIGCRRCGGDLDGDIYCLNCFRILAPEQARLTFQTNRAAIEAAGAQLGDQGCFGCFADGKQHDVRYMEALQVYVREWSERIDSTLAMARKMEAEALSDYEGETLYLECQS